MSDTITLFSPDELAAMAERERAATPPPWHLAKDGQSIRQTKHVTRDVWTIPHREGDMAFIAESRNEYAHLLAVAQWANELAKAAAQLAEDCEQRDWVEADPEWLSAVEAVNNLLARLAPPVNS